MNRGVTISNMASGISSPGVYAAILVGSPQIIYQAAFSYSGSATAAGTFTLDLLGMDGSWRTLSPSPIGSIAANGFALAVLNGYLVKGIRLNVLTLTAGTLTYAEITGLVQ